MPVLLAYAALAAAQPAAAAAVSPATPQSSLIIDQGRADRLPAGTANPPDPAAASPGMPMPEIGLAGSGAPIRSIRFDGVPVPATVAAAARRFIGRRADAATLNRIAAAMSDAYGKSDIALYTIVIPDQDLSGGRLRVTVVEGFIERVAVPPGAGRLLRAYAAQLAAERPLTRRTLERYLSLMRDIPGMTVDAQLLRGTRAGGVILDLKVRQKRFNVTFGFDNQGVGSLGTAEFEADAHAYGLLREGDHTALTGLATPDFNRLRYASISHATPVGDAGMVLTLSGGYLATRPRDSMVDGDARTYGATLAYPLIRGYKRNLTASLGIDAVDSDAAVFGTVFSSDHTRALRGAVGYSYASAKSAFTAGLTANRGLGILHARGTAFFTDPVFTKLNGRVTYDRQIGRRFFTHMKAAGQYSGDRLAAAERFAAGGSDFGRAFDQAVLTGDQGLAGSLEIAFRPPLPKTLAGSEIYVFADGARVHLVERLPYAYAGTYDLASAGAGARLAYAERASLGLEVARAIDRPFANDRETWRFNLSWRLKLKKG